MFQGKVKTEWLTKGVLSPTGGKDSAIWYFIPEPFTGHAISFIISK
jgi:hypothetical protein